MDPRFTSRKWVLTLLVLLLAIGARGCSWVDGAQLVSLVTWSVGLYMAGNVGESVAGKISIGNKS
jgi:hypothetical protein